MRLCSLFMILVTIAFVNLSCETNSSSIADNSPLKIKVVTIVTYQDIDAIDQPNTGEAYWWSTLHMFRYLSGPTYSCSSQRSNPHTLRMGFGRHGGNFRISRTYCYPKKKVCCLIRAHYKH